MTPRLKLKMFVVAAQIGDCGLVRKLDAGRALVRARRYTVDKPARKPPKEKPAPAKAPAKGSRRKKGYEAMPAGKRGGRGAPPTAEDYLDI